VRSNSPEQPKLPLRLSALHAVGLISPDHAGWLHLRELKHGRLREGAPIRSVSQLLAMCLAVAMIAGSVSWWQLAAWFVAGLVAVAHSMLRDGELARARQRSLTPRDIWRHATGLAGCGVVWAVPLLLLGHLGTAATHLALWALTAMLATGLALTTRAAPLATLLFAGTTGAAAIAGFALHGEWAFAAVSSGFMTAALYGTVEGARSCLVGRMAEAGLADKEKLVSLLLREFEDHDADWLWQIDTSRRVRRVSARFAYALGQEPESIEGRPLLELAAGEGWASGTFPPSLHEFSNQLKRRQSFSNLLVQVDVGGQQRWWRLSGAPLTDESGRFAGYRGVGSDVTVRHVSEQRIAYLARHDALTGLPNRAMLTETLQDELRTTERRDGRCALLLVDLDRFKAVNDTLGHPVGDKLLVQVGVRLRSALGEGVLCARLGGDEFAAVVPEARIAELDALAQTLIDQLSQPFEVDGHRLSIGASVGSAEGPVDGTTVEALMRHADLALYRAKTDGRGVHHRYQPELRADAEARRRMELSLRHAVAREELLLAYQPIIEATAEQLTGFEALLRWNSSEHGLIEPARVIPLAEASRLILPIGDWVLREACRQAARWPAPLKVAINLSAAQLLEPDFGACVSQALSDTGLEPQRLQLEVQESALLADSGHVLATLGQLRKMGCRTALDDFGTGTSSLSELRRFRFSTVKIDRSSVRGATCGYPEELAIVRAVVAIAESIGMTATAEGVESAEEAAFMRRMGCSRLQGFYYGRPMTGTEAMALACRRPPAPVEPAAPCVPDGQSASAAA
jgi:diguanylate cyclase (GGDEF)-like protein/PAS domain S-box-containing protein